MTKTIVQTLIEQAYAYDSPKEDRDYDHLTIENNITDLSIEQGNSLSLSEMMDDIYSELEMETRPDSPRDSTVKNICERYFDFKSIKNRPRGRPPGRKIKDILFKYKEKRPRGRPPGPPRSPKPRKSYYVKKVNP